jgi:ribulose-bisphosphate carboxylase large chain
MERSEMPGSRIEADYLLETPDDPSRVAELMAGEQSSGTFVAIPGETEELKSRVAARVSRLQVVDETVTSASLP